MGEIDRKSILNTYDLVFKINAIERIKHKAPRTTQTPINQALNISCMSSSELAPVWKAIRYKSSSLNKLLNLLNCTVLVTAL